MSDLFLGPRGFSFRAQPSSISTNLLSFSMPLRWLFLAVVLINALLATPPAKSAPKFDPVDTALVIAVDVSNSVDERRYRLQMNGIANALSDPAVVGTILNGAQGAILVSVVTWSDRPRMALPWMRIASQEEAFAVARRVRALPHTTGEFTCVANMLRYLNDKVLPTVPAMALRKVVDVSGDGQDNCNSRVATPDIRDELVRYGTIVNGLPILEGKEALTLEQWYDDNVRGGPGSFVLAAKSFEDFGRAIRQKFIVEISGINPGTRYARADETSDTKIRSIELAPNPVSRDQAKF
ncbi:MAG: DUF1194 domain-containing protein [Filomicrobium sp.]